MATSSHIDRPRGAPAPRELVRTWALAVGGLALAKLLSLADPTGLLRANLAGVAAFLFIALPDAKLRARGEDWPDYGVPLHGLADARTWAAFGRGALVALAAGALVFPIFAAGFWAYAELLPHLPRGLARVLAPYAGLPRFAFRWPPGLPLLVLVQLLVVALPEELFYRGWMQTSWAATDPARRVRILGADLGRGFLATQALFAAWVEHLFDAPPQESLSFPSLEPVLRDPGRNFLFDYLSKGEDQQVPAKPDCADLSYFLRAYFAWKLGLPVSYRACGRGSATSPPRCDQAQIVRTFVGTAASAGAFRQVSRRLMDRVTSGSGRTALADDATDFYPVPLARAALWPGTVYADPFGHTLVIVKWVPQTQERAGLLLAVDAQPDNSVARKRFWEGTFLFAQTPSAGPGFKAYRPPLAGGANARLASLRASSKATSANMSMGPRSLPSLSW